MAKLSITVAEYVVGTGKRDVMPQKLKRYLADTRGIQPCWVSGIGVHGREIVIDFWAPQRWFNQQQKGRENGRLSQRQPYGSRTSGLAVLQV